MVSNGKTNKIMHVLLTVQNKTYSKLVVVRKYEEKKRFLYDIVV